MRPYLEDLKYLAAITDSMDKNILFKGIRPIFYPIEKKNHYYSFFSSS